jgi:hypothetical protein
MDLNGEWIFKDLYICSMATKVSQSHFKILSQGIICTGQTLGKGTLTDGILMK